MSFLDTSDDFELCNRVFCELSKDAIKVDTCSDLERVVRLVWDSSGLMGNGGLHRLLEGNYPGDPAFVYTVDAYRHIGAQSACEALQAAFRRFPGGVLPIDIRERLRIFESIPKQIWDQIEARYYAADKETERCLARFIRKNRSEYEYLIEMRRAEQQVPPDGRQKRGHR